MTLDDIVAKVTDPYDRQARLYPALLCLLPLLALVALVPAPLLVHIHKGSTFNDLTYLSEQVLKFTGLSWRSTLPAKKPVSIYYSELIAGLLGRLRNVPGWSPAVLNTRLRASRWFL